MKISYVGRNLGNINLKNKDDVGWGNNIPEFTLEQIHDFSHVFKFLNNKDRDILYLIFVTRLKQNSVQRILNRSQPSLCYDIKRIKKRLQFIYYLHSVLDVFLDFLENRSSTYEPEMVEIMTLMFYTTSLTHTANILKQPQIKIRYKFEKSIKLLEENQDWGVYEIFSYIRTNLNIIKRFYKAEIQFS